MRIGWRSLFFTAPWLGGVLGALLPLIWLWASYPVAHDSRTAIARITKTAIVEREKLAPTGSQGVAYVVCYEMTVSFDFEVNREKHAGTDVLESCDLNALNRRAEQLMGSRVTAIYNQRYPERAFLVEMISKTKLKLAAGLSVLLLVLGTAVAGQKSGRYQSDMLNISFSDVQPKFVLAGFLLISFFIWLLLA